jgi:uncharacterized membrane protein
VSRRSRASFGQLPSRPLRARLAVMRLHVSAAIGALALAIAFVAGASLVAAALTGWTAASLVFVSWVWATLARKDASQTARAATAEDDRTVRDAIVLVASTASLVAVLVILGQAGGAHGFTRGAMIVLALASVLLAWACIQTVYALRYARLYYGAKRVPIDFHDPESPDYVDFLYLAVTIGMTFQVSDTDLTARTMRRAAIGHALLSYVFGAVIIAVAVNLVASLLGR